MLNKNFNMASHAFEMRRLCCYLVYHFLADACAVQYVFIVVNVQNTTSAFCKIV